jgi:hypothetical protein
MKKLLTVFLIALLILSAAACSKNTPASSSVDLTQWKTLGDIWEYEFWGSVVEEGTYIRAFKAEDGYYRVETDVPQDVAEKLDAIDFFDKTGEEQEKALMKDLPIKTIINLSEVLLSQSDLDALAGKTGQELLDMGFVPQGSKGFSTQEQLSWATLEKGPFVYEVTFQEYVDVDDDPNIAAVIRPLTVKSAELVGLSQYSTEKEFDINGGKSLADYEAMFNED